MTTSGCATNACSRSSAKTRTANVDPFEIPLDPFELEDFLERESNIRAVSLLCGLDRDEIADLGGV